MPHSDDDDLAMSALEGGLAGDETCACSRCEEERAAYRRTIAAARAGVELERPAPSVWDRIAAEIESGQEAGPGGAPALAPVAETFPQPTPLPVAETSLQPTPAAEAEPPGELAPPEEPAPPAPGAGAPRAAHPGAAPNDARGDARDELATRRADRAGRANPWARRSAWIAAAAFVVGIASTLAVQQLTAPGAPEVLASATLDPLPGWEATGSAVVEQVGDRRELVIELPTGAVDGFREVWLIDRDVQRLVSIGVLADDEGRFPLPDGLDLAEFPIVDVSREPIDGDPAHSGDSIVRGDLA